MTKEETAEVIKVMQAFVDGKIIQCKNGQSVWVDMHFHPNWDWSKTQYRIKPEPQLVPWEGPQDVPLNAVFQHKDCTDGSWFTATDVNREGICYWVRGLSGSFNYLKLFIDFNYSLDGKTWLTCGKVVE